MSDRLLRMLDNKQNIRVFAAETTEMVEAARRIHNLSPVAAAALGRTLTVGAMMGKMNKNPSDKLTIQIKGDGPIGGIVVVANYQAGVKGYVNNADVYLPPTQLGKLDVGGAVGKDGYINIIKDLGLKEPYIGFVPLVSGEIGEDLAYYFYKSEQTPSIVALGVLVEKTGEVIAAGGFIIQVMPGAGDDVISKLENNTKDISSVTTYLSQGMKIEDIVRMVIGSEDVEIMETTTPEFLCDCSHERMERVLASIGRQELIDILEKEGEIEIQCHFCLEKHTFGQEDINSILGN